MEIAFKTKQLHKDCNSAKQLTKKYGNKRDQYIMRRIKVLAAAPTLADVPRQPPDRCHQLTGDRKENFAVVIKDQWRIVFEPKHDPIPRKEDKALSVKEYTSLLVFSSEKRGSNPFLTFINSNDVDGNDGRPIKRGLYSEIQ